MANLAETTTGHNLSTGVWLDAHFETAREEYEDALRWVGILPGWRVLDAGSGAGNYLPLMSRLAGPGGMIDAVDLAPENVARVQEIAATLDGAPVTATVSSISQLPFDDGVFDCAWCANVAQYLSPSEFHKVLAEFRRVLKPGGVLAIKDTDATHVQLHPLDADILARFLIERRREQADTGVLGTACGTSLPGWLRRSGYVDIKPRGLFIERWAPLAPYGREFVKRYLSFCAEKAATALNLFDDDKRYWVAMSESPDKLLGNPDFCLREVQVLAIGRKALSS